MAASMEDVRVLASPARTTHHTWALTFFCRPELYLQPSSIEQLQTIVRAAHQFKKTVTVTGAGHSPSDITMTKDWLINLDDFDNVLSFSRHESGLFTDVRVEAGIRIYQLNAVLASRGLALQNLGSISDQSVAGIISTGTHGSSAYHGLISQQIVDITLLLASGDLLTVSPTVQPDLFRAAILSLGKLGIITHVTVRAIPSFTVHSFQEIVDFDKLLEDWDTVWTSKEYVRVWWFPYSRKCILWRAQKSGKSLSAPRESFYGTWLGRKLYELLLWFATRIYKRAMPAVERFVFRRQYGWQSTYGQGGSEAVQNSVEALNMDCLFRQFVNEWALPLKHGVEVLKQVDQAVTKAAESGAYYVHAPIEVRCSNCSYPNEETTPFEIIEKSGGIGALPGNTLRPLLDYSPVVPYAYTEPISNENLTLYLNATMYRPFGHDPPIGQWYREFEDIMVAYSGKPHWAKNFIGKSPEKTTDVPSKDGEMIGLANVFDSWYGEDGTKYKAIRLKLDPEGIFLGGKEWAVRNGVI
ncbi:D-arabinono-1,4-lactone oxidase-domain-containing protein [Lipomyces tetrasporus]|uniref:D-arabinono-1,4-lactone oxidase n=1 Tax=Lipomyces tetrasporus TaxID=54092 RepID=A0AAD7QLI9_9ASCO|nr:D-arabinono-1,4-lactone oxidase-domain-containing protein [Lipomyces tetrasporus]KAJ8097550.1 D-arabinono-1,4-lactone oxidase-domain-containing protein [Lipomyces tetrasporus]